MSQNDKHTESTSNRMEIARRGALAAGALGLGILGTGTAKGERGQGGPSQEKFVRRGPNFHNVLSYGADPDGEEDSTDEIQAAVNAAAEDDPTGTVYLPAGEYLVSNTNHPDYDGVGIYLEPKHSGITITGDGKATRVQSIDQEEGIMIYRTRPWDGEEHHKNITIERHHVRGSGMEQEGYRERGIRLDTQDTIESTGSIIRNMYVSEVNGTGISLGHTNSRIEGCHVFDCGRHGIYLPQHYGIERPPEGTNQRVVTNVIAERCGKGPASYSDGRPVNYGIDVSKDSAIVSNFICYDCAQGLKTSGDHLRSVITNGILFENDIDGFKMISNHPIDEDMGKVTYVDNILSWRNGGDGFGWNVNRASVGNIFAWENEGAGFNFRGSEVVADQLYAQSNGEEGLDVYRRADVDVMHYMGGDVSVADDSDLWVFRSPDYDEDWVSMVEDQLDIR